MATDTGGGVQQPVAQRLGLYRMQFGEHRLGQGEHICSDLESSSQTALITSCRDGIQTSPASLPMPLRSSARARAVAGF